MMDKHSQYQNPLAIRRIVVRKLFGTFNYDLSSQNLDQLSKVFILYGDNGSGKTTVLNLVFHLLAPEDGQNHRTYLGQSIFNELFVELADGIRISAKRPNESVKGRYTLAIHNQELLVAEAELVPNEQNVLSRLEIGTDLDKLLKMISDLHLAMFYLSDDRTIKRSGYGSRSSAVQVIRTNRGELIRRTDDSDQEAKLLESAMNRAVQWIRQQYVRGSKIGQDNANSIYTAVISQIANAKSTKPSQAEFNPNEVLARLLTLTERNNSFSSFGLTTPMTSDDFAGPLRKASRPKKQIIASVLQPYLDGLNARLNALQEIHGLIATFAGNLNSFYANKQIRFNLNDGLHIVTNQNTSLSPQTLSSGERQLLLMFCNVLTSRDRSGIFIIDEPEISLNVKWQRRLLDALLDCTRGSNIQFLIASHSIELIAPHEGSVIKLESL
ncbi:MAG: AAA family ATPase [Nitrospirales bacterium]